MYDEVGDVDNSFGANIDNAYVLFINDISSTYTYVPVEHDG